MQTKMSDKYRRIGECIHQLEELENKAEHIVARAWTPEILTFKLDEHEAKRIIDSRRAALLETLRGLGISRRAYRDDLGGQIASPRTDVDDIPQNGPESGAPSSAGMLVWPDGHTQPYPNASGPIGGTLAEARAIAESDEDPCAASRVQHP